MKRLLAFAVVAIGYIAFSLVTVSRAETRGSFVIWTGAATDTSALYMADSSATFFTAPYQRLQLFLKPNKPCRVAIQVRSHGDSLSGSGVPALTDTSKTYAWSWRSLTNAAAADSAVWIETLGAPAVPRSSSQQGQDEYVVDFREDAVATANKKWGGPRGKTIDLVKIDSGIPYWGPHTSIRVRVLGGSGVVTWTGSLQGISF